MQRGLESRQEVDPNLLLRDTRPLLQRVTDFFSNRTNTAIVLVALCAAIFLLPVASDWIFLLGAIFFAYSYTRPLMLPFRMPKCSGATDYNDISPGTNKPNKARGITYFGNDIKTGEELWFHNEDMRTHVLIFGSTGSGKTETLVSLAYNALVQASGFIYVDGKGDNTLYSKIFSMARSLGREDDLLLVNFMTGAKDIVGPQESRLSNTMNPFSMGSSSMLSQLVVSLMDSASQTPDGDMWKGRAIAFVEALMKILVYMRDEGAILLDANSIRNYFVLERLEAMAIDKQFIRDGQDPVSLESAPEVVLEPIKNYLATLPGYTKERKGKQVSQTLEQHGFITMQLTRVFTSLADTYGHIMRTKLAEVDFKDVVLNRRILVVLLPALEKSPDELSNLGKVIVSSLKAMMAAGLGESVEGEYEDIIQRKPTNALTPFLCILDEYGYYAVQGFAVVPAQARSLGFSAIFAGQDLPAFQKTSKEEAASIGANTNIKICMKLEDPTETWEFFTKTAGESYVTKVDAFQVRDTSVTNSYLDTKSSSFEKRARVDLLDLKEQNLGEAHIFFKSKIIRARMFYANPKPAKRMRINHFLKVDTPQESILLELEQRMERFKQILSSEDVAPLISQESEDIQFIANALKEEDYDNPIERGVSALMAFQNRDQENIVETGLLLEENIEETPQDELNVFTERRINSDVEQFLLTKDVESFNQPLLMRVPTRTQLAKVERALGKTDKLASNVAQEVIKDMEIATFYPPEDFDHISSEDLAGVAQELNQEIRVAREKARLKKEQEGSSVD
ncbi:MAG: TraM recognition domain-containing protein [Proteobacteria bacterium]|nr:TraM recognition domain-containing protein [Pseudomonadota bacterium]